MHCWSSRLEQTNRSSEHLEILENYEMTHTLHSAWANRLECKCGIRHQQIGNCSCATDPQSKDFILTVHSPYQSRVCGQKSLLGDRACTDYTDSGEMWFPGFFYRSNHTAGVTKGNRCSTSNYRSYCGSLYNMLWKEKSYLNFSI